MHDKNDALNNANSKLIREANNFKILCNQLQNKDKYYENIKKEHEIIKKRMFDLGVMLQSAKKNFEKKIKTKFVDDRRQCVIFVKNDAILLKANSNFVNHSLRCLYCMQHGHLRKYYYVSKNISMGMKARWIRVGGTKFNGPNQKWVPKVKN